MRLEFVRAFGTAANVAVIALATSSAGVQLGPFSDNNATWFAGFGAVSPQQPQFGFSGKILAAGGHRYSIDLLETISNALTGH